MNRIFKVIWSKAKNCYVVASELAKSRTKAPKSNVISHELAVSVLTAIFSFGAVLPVLAATYSAGGGSATGTNAVAIGTSVSATGNYSFAIGSGSKASNINTIAIGRDAVASGDHMIAIGVGATDGGNYGINSVAIGRLAKAYENNTVAIGCNPTANGYRSIVIGNDSLTQDKYSVGIGYNSKIYGNYSVGVGNGSKTEYDNGTAIGNAAIALGTCSTVLGGQSVVYTGTDHSVALGADSTASDSNVVSFGHKAGDIISYTLGTENELSYESNFTRRLINVSDGIDDHDVSTVGQMHTYTTPADNGNYVAGFSAS